MIAVIFVLLRRLEKSTKLHLDFFFLGVGFSLTGVSGRCAAGTGVRDDWVVSAVVFASVLLTVFLANCMLELKPNIRLGLVWIGLLVCLAVNFFFPVQNAAGILPPYACARRGAAGRRSGIFRGHHFQQTVQQEPEVGFPFGINMVGAMTGGSIEYLSMLMGMKNIWLVLVIYFLAYLCHRHKKIAASV